MGRVRGSSGNGEKGEQTNQHKNCLRTRATTVGVDKIEDLLEIVVELVHVAHCRHQSARIRDLGPEEPAPDLEVNSVCWDKKASLASNGELSEPMQYIATGFNRRVPVHKSTRVPVLALLLKGAQGVYRVLCTVLSALATCEDGDCQCGKTGKAAPHSTGKSAPEHREPRDHGGPNIFVQRSTTWRHPALTTKTPKNPVPFKCGTYGIETVSAKACL